MWQTGSEIKGAADRPSQRRLVFKQRQRKDSGHRPETTKVKHQDPSKWTAETYGGLHLVGGGRGAPGEEFTNLSAGESSSGGG